MSTAPLYPLEGGCDCRQVRYRLLAPPMFVHCCHCRWCQRESGASFALNALIEADRLELIAGEPELVDTPSESGQGQQIARCPNCRMALWSHYAGAGPLVSFVRVGTLDQPDHLPPDIHIFTASKQPWLMLPSDVPGDGANTTTANNTGRRRAWRAGRHCGRKSRSIAAASKAERAIEHVPIGRNAYAQPKTRRIMAILIGPGGQTPRLE